MKILYFAILREHTGTATEDVPLPGDVRDVAALVTHLRGKSHGHARALADMKAVRVAVNKKYASLDTAIADGDEIAFFPPVTGG